VAVLVVDRADQLQDQLELPTVAEITRNHHQGAAVELACRQDFGLKRARCVEFLELKMMARQPHLRLPAAWQRRGGAQGLKVRERCSL
jgi:hypothetical protein